MEKHVLRAAAFCIAAICWLSASSAHAQLRAFGDAEGFGALTTGGRAGSLYIVTNLNDSGAGSFRDAVSQSNRIIVFAVGGYINLASAISAKSNLTILGQTAPGQGIGLMGHELSFSASSNDIVEFIRAREGSADSSAKASINLGDTSNMILNHVDAEYSQYDNIDAVGTNGVNNVTLQNSLLADPIKAQQLNMHTEGNNVTYVNNLWVNSHGRNPLAKSNSQYINNVVYNYQYAFTTGNSAGVYSYDILNNYFIAGPNTNSPSDAWYQLDSNQSAYSSGNLLDSNKNDALDGSATSPGGVVTLSSPWSSTTASLPLLSTAAAYTFDVAHAGDSLQRDTVDTQVITQVQSLGTQGSIYNTEKDTGLSNSGFGTITGGTPPTSSANDGIPDTWAAAHGLSTTDPSGALKLNPLGYTMIEQYANELGDEYASQTWSNASGTWSSGTWSSAVPGVFDHALIRGNGSVDGMVTVSTGTASAMTLSIGGNGTSTGEKVFVSGGTLNVYDTITVGDQGNGTLQITSGAVQAYNIILGNTVYNPTATNYTGTLSLMGGTLAVSQIVLGAGTPSNWTSGGSINWSAGTLQAAAQLNVNVPMTVSGAGGTINSNGFNGTLSGVISGAGGITKTGLGTITLTASNLYSGATTVKQGTLTLGASNRIADTSNLVLSGGTFATGGFSDTLSTLKLSASSTIDLGTGASILDFTDSHELPWTGTLTVANWSGSTSGGGTDRLFFGSGSGGLSLAQLNSIVFSGTASPHAVQLSTGEIVPGTPAPVPVLGDFNHDGSVSAADILPMINALANLSAYQAGQNYTDVDLLANGDLNNDGKVTNADLQDLLVRLSHPGGGNTAPVPEPSGFVLAAFALISIGAVYRSALRTGKPSRLSTKFTSGFPAK
ncbi:MAG TPA: dockerin type I domain-containing protein [Pirellulales bacterium]|nr:dockerin type I domain-containing protein [Pirellulales bacterium]